MSTLAATDIGLFSFDQVRAFLPHRYPFLLVDRILSIKGARIDLPLSDSQALEGVEVVGLKGVSGNEPFFQGHFPHYAIMPGVLQLEAMAQVAGFSIYPHARSAAGPGGDIRPATTILAGSDGVRFRRPVVPGDLLTIRSMVKRRRGSVMTFECEITVDSKRVAEAELIAQLTGEFT